MQCLENSRNARNEVGVGSDMTITFLKNNSGDDMEDRSELGGPHRAWTGAHAVGLEGRDLVGKAQQGPASLCLQGLLLHYAFIPLVLFTQPREGKSQHTSWVVNPPKSLKTLNMPWSSLAVLIINIHLLWMETKSQMVTWVFI